MSTTDENHRTHLRALRDQLLGESESDPPGGNVVPGEGNQPDSPRHVYESRGGFLRQMTQDADNPHR